MENIMVAVLVLAGVIFTGFPIEGAQNIYYSCPERFFRAGNQCYYLSTDVATWREAHFKCQDRNRSTLAILDKKIQDKKVRFKLNRKRNEAAERWIGGTYDWGRNMWVWGVTGKKIKYQAFSRRDPRDEYKWKCIILNPRNRNRWSTRSCLEKKHYLCETPLQEIRIEFRQNSPEDRRPNYDNGVRRKRHKCPDKFFLAMNKKCYFISKEKANWREASFKCREMDKSELVVLDREIDDRQLRATLRRRLQRGKTMEESWIGGVYDWNRELWMWGPTGCTIWHQDFLKNKTQVHEIQTMGDRQHHCIIIDPQNNFRWASRKCYEERTFICEKKAQRIGLDGQVPNERYGKLKSEKEANEDEERGCDFNNNTY